MTLRPPDPRAPTEPGVTYPPTKPDDRDTTPMYWTTDDHRQIINENDEVVVHLANGCSIVSGWCDADDPNARLSGQYLRLEDPGGKEIVYYDHSEWETAPESYEVIGAFVNIAAGFRGRTALPRPRELEFSDSGNPIFTLHEKLLALRYCFNNGQDEDVLGHLFDLLNHASNVGGWVGEMTEEALIDLYRLYGSNPTPIRGLHDAAR